MINPNYIQYKNDQPKFPINEIKQMSTESPKIANQLIQMVQNELDQENDRDNKIFELLNNQQHMTKQEFQEEIKIYKKWSMVWVWCSCFIVDYKYSINIIR